MSVRQTGQPVAGMVRVWVAAWQVNLYDPLPNTGHTWALRDEILYNNALYKLTLHYTLLLATARTLSTQVELKQAWPRVEREIVMLAEGGGVTVYLTV